MGELEVIALILRDNFDRHRDLGRGRRLEPELSSELGNLAKSAAYVASRIPKKVGQAATGRLSFAALA
jgi:hypothetical protein